MHYLAYLIPLLTLGGLYLYDPSMLTSHPIEELAILVAVALAVVGITHALVRYFGKDIEYLSGYAVTAKHYYPWTERVVYYETVSDGKSKTRQVQRVRYVQHPDEWEWVLNTGHTSNISHQLFEEIAYTWTQRRTYHISTHHVNCVAGGGGEAVDWDEELAHAYTETYTARYTNPLDHSNSIFRYRDISKKEARELGLYDYPDIHGYEQDPIIGLDIATQADNRAFQLLNALFGAAHQVHFFVLLFDAAKGLTIGEDQRAYWHGGNKNEFTICLGIETREVEEKTAEGELVKREQHLLKWCNAFSWMDEPVLEMAIEDWARDRIDQPLDLQDFAEWLREHLSLWKRKEWKDFAYLSNPMQTWQILTIFGVAIAAAVGVWYYLYGGYSMGDFMSDDVDTADRVEMFLDWILE